jgi:glycine/D-amino acid oxidase-like deaminating enzyme
MKFDAAVIGQGLAGSAMAWTLSLNGLAVCLMDRGSSTTASRIAAGLITPVTGIRQVKSADYDQQWELAKKYYQQVEKITGRHFFVEVPMVRLFRNEQEIQQFTEHRIKEHPKNLVARFDDDGRLTGYQMKPAGRLLTDIYLEATRHHFSSTGCFFQTELNLNSDMRITADGVFFPNERVETRVVIFCQGYQSERNPWFSEIPDAPVRGDILRVRIDDHQQHEIQHRGIWLVPLGNSEYLVGSTYDREHLSAEPSPEGAATILSQLQCLTQRRIEVLSHQAAVRAGTKDRKPVAGFHHHYPQLAILNGLGAKGSLLAPVAAAALLGEVRQQIEGTRATSVNVTRSLTRIAQEKLQSVIRWGDTVIDATAGNGHDTLFLSRAVGGSGRVIAIDIQNQALSNTRQRLEKADAFGVVELYQMSHERLDELNCSPGTATAVMFNLGYLPGGDRSIVTSPGATRSAVIKASTLLKPGGMMTIVGYRGHSGGKDETAALTEQVKELDQSVYETQFIEGNSADSDSPLLVIVSRRCFGTEGHFSVK